MTPNKFKGVCAVCAKTVPARTGVVAKSGAKWLVYCSAHQSQVSANPPPFVPDHFDMLVEDNMRDACGC